MHEDEELANETVHIGVVAALYVFPDDAVDQFDLDDSAKKKKKSGIDLLLLYYQISSNAA